MRTTTRVVFRNIHSGATFVVVADEAHGKEAVARMEALPSWHRSST